MQKPTQMLQDIPGHLSLWRSTHTGVFMSSVEKENICLHVPWKEQGCKQRADWAVSVTLAPLIMYVGEKQLWPDIGGQKGLRWGVIVKSYTRKHNDNCVDNPSVLKILNWNVWRSRVDLSENRYQQIKIQKAQPPEDDRYPEKKLVCQSQKPHPL